MLHFLLLTLLLSFIGTSKAEKQTLKLNTEPTTFSKNGGGETLTFWGEFLLWKPRTNTWPETVIAKGQALEYISVPSLYSPGIRVGINQQLSRDTWNLSFVATSFKQASPPLTIYKTTTLTFPTHPSLTDFVTNSMRTSFITLDALIGKKFLEHNSFSCRFAMGVKALWLKNEEEEKYTRSSPVTSFTSTSSTSFTAAGLLGQFDSLWTINHGFGIYGTLQLALVRGSNNDNQTTITNSVASTLSRPRLFTEINIVCEWGAQLAIKLNKERGFFTLSAGYEFNNLVNETLLLQGLNLKAGLDFRF